MTLPALIRDRRRRHIDTRVWSDSTAKEIKKKKPKWIDTPYVARVKRGGGKHFQSENTRARERVFFFLPFASVFVEHRSKNGLPCKVLRGFGAHTNARWKEKRKM